MLLLSFVVSFTVVFLNAQYDEIESIDGVVLLFLKSCIIGILFFQIVQFIIDIIK